MSEPLSTRSTRERENLESECTTSFEKMLVGGTMEPDIQVEDYHTPISVVRKKKTVEEANQLRSRLEYMIVAPQIFSLDPIGNTRVAVSLEELDSATGATVRDPKVLGVVDQEPNTIKEIEGRDLNKEFYLKLKEHTEKYPAYAAELPWTHARDAKGLIESQSPGDPEKG